MRYAFSLITALVVFYFGTTASAFVFRENLKEYYAVNGVIAGKKAPGVAVIQDKNRGKQFFLKIGDKLPSNAGFKITEIGKDYVTVSDGADSQKIMKDPFGGTASTSSSSERQESPTLAAAPPPYAGDDDDFEPSDLPKSYVDGEPLPPPPLEASGTYQPHDHDSAPPRPPELDNQFGQEYGHGAPSVPAAISNDHDADDDFDDLEDR